MSCRKSKENKHTIEKADSIASSLSFSSADLLSILDLPVRLLIIPGPQSKMSIHINLSLVCACLCGERERFLTLHKLFFTATQRLLQPCKLFMLKNSPFLLIMCLSLVNIIYKDVSENE